jgi:hypothetical protein
MSQKKLIKNKFKFSTNLKTFLSIAKESQSKSKIERKPIPNSTGRFVISGNPGSFKNALICIAFVGIYLDEFLYIQGLGKVDWSNMPKKFLKCFEKMTYEEKLEVLGIDDKKLLEDCKKFRESRNDLIHEKPVIWESTGIPVPSQKIPIGTAQEDAEKAILLIDRVHNALSL